MKILDLFIAFNLDSSFIFNKIKETKYCIGMEKSHEAAIQKVDKTSNLSKCIKQLALSREETIVLSPRANEAPNTAEEEETSSRVAHYYIRSTQIGHKFSEDSGATISSNHFILPSTAKAGLSKSSVFPYTKNKWALLRTVLQAVARLKRKEVETILDNQGLEKALASYTPRSRSMSYYWQRHSTAFEDALNENQLHELIARGAPEDIRKIDALLTKGKEANLFDPSDDNNVVNRPNRFGKTPLYIASQNGNMALIKYLVLKQAKPEKRSKISSKEEESNLAVAARWKHEGVVKYYLENFEWEKDDLQQAKAVAGTKKIQKMIGSKVSKGKGENCCFLCFNVKNKKMF